MPESAYGPTNQCIGLGKVLVDKGHTVVFAAESSWAGKLAPYGFVEDLVDLAPPDPAAGEEAARPARLVMAVHRQAGPRRPLRW